MTTIDYLNKLNPLIKDYYKILSDDFPEFLLDYINTPRMKKQDKISVSCGTYYSQMSNNNLISINDLYELSEEEVINLIKKCKLYNISKCFNIWQESKDVLVSDNKPIDKYYVYVKAKKRYIDPLVKTKDGIKRISEVSEYAKDKINNILNYTFDRYIYMDFNLEDKTKVKSL